MVLMREHVVLITKRRATLDLRWHTCAQEGGVAGKCEKSFVTVFRFNHECRKWSAILIGTFMIRVLFVFISSDVYFFKPNLIFFVTFFQKTLVGSKFLNPFLNPLQISSPLLKSSISNRPNLGPVQKPEQKKSSHLPRK